MKVYRIVPDTFSTVVGTSVLGSYNYLGFEDLYYKMGYTSLQTNEMISSFINNLGVNTFDNSDGKHFFLYPEENLQHACFLSKYITLNYVLLEYDFPIDILADSFGYGTYNTKFLVEFCIDFKKISTKVETSSFNKEEKRKMFIESLEYTKSKLKDFEKYGSLLIEAMETYYQYVALKSQIFESESYQTFITKNDEIYQNPYLTGNYAFISFNELVSVLEKRRCLKDLLLEKNMIVSDSRININDNLEQELINNYNNNSQDEIKKILTKTDI
jgi:hypothetical protein